MGLTIAGGICLLFTLIAGSCGGYAFWRYHTASRERAEADNAGGSRGFVPTTSDQRALYRDTGQFMTILSVVLLALGTLFVGFGVPKVTQTRGDMLQELYELLDSEEQYETESRDRLTRIDERWDEIREVLARLEQDQADAKIGRTLQSVEEAAGEADPR